MDFSAIGAFEYVTVCDDAIGFDEEAAAARQFFAARVESFNCHCGGFDAANQFGKKILSDAASRDRS